VTASEIGTRLREAREGRGLTLEQVQADTKIRLRYLKALEDGDYEVIPGEAYARGFLRSYANYLGLDGLELVRLYTQERAAKPPTSEPIFRPPVQRRGPRAAGALVGLLVLAAVATYYFGVLPRRQEAQPEPPPAAEDVRPLPDEGEPVVPEPPGPPPPPQVRVTREDAGDEVRYRVAGDFLQVLVELADDCWLGVDLDGRRVLEATLPVGSVRVFQAEREIRMRVGRPGSLFVTINDEEQGLVFQDRATSPRTLIFTLLPE